MNKLIVVLGPTGCGKTELSLHLAQRFNAEIICADSRTVYKGLDIGTAKPSKEERLAVRHHLLDIAEPGEPVSVAKFKRLAQEAIEGINSRGKIAILVGGSGLYIDSVIFDYQFPGMDVEYRQGLWGLNLDEMVHKLRKLDPGLADRIDLKNRRRVERALETIGQPRLRLSKPLEGTLVLGLAMDKKVIRKRVEQRIKKMLDKGLINEVREMGKKFGWDLPAMQAPAYLAFKGVIEGTKTIEEASAEFLNRDMQLVKKQLTWFRRNKSIIWLDAKDVQKLRAEAKRLVEEFTA